VTGSRAQEVKLLKEKQEWHCPDCSTVIMLSQFPERSEFLITKMKHQISHVLNEAREQRRVKSVAEPAGTP